MSYILYITDCETTGTEKTNHDIIEISFCRLTLDNPEKFEQKTWLIRAVNPTTITERALTINGHKKEDITHMTKFGRENYLEPTEVISQIESWIMEDGCSVDERVLCGQNIQFDYEFMREFWKRSGSEETFPFGEENRTGTLLDTIAITRFIDVCGGKRRERYNLINLVKDFKVHKRTAHRAADDVLMTKDLLLKQLLPLRNIIVELFKNTYERE